MHYQTPKTNMKPENPRLEKEKHRPKPPIVGFHVSFVGVQSPTTKKHTLPKTNIAPENRSGPKRKPDRIPTIHFRVRTEKTTQLEPPATKINPSPRFFYKKRQQKLGPARLRSCCGRPVLRNGSGLPRDGWGSYRASQDPLLMTQESSKSTKRLAPKGRAIPEFFAYTWIILIATTPLKINMEHN